MQKRLSDGLRFCLVFVLKNDPGDIMKKRFVGHPLMTRAYGAVLVRQISKKSFNRNGIETSVRPNGTPVMPVLRSRSARRPDVHFSFSFAIDHLETIQVCQKSRYVKNPGMSNIRACQKSGYVKNQGMSKVRVRQKSGYVKKLRLSIIRVCQARFS